MKQPEVKIRFKVVGGPYDGAICRFEGTLNVENASDVGDALSRMGALEYGGHTYKITEFCKETMLGVMIY